MVDSSRIKFFIHLDALAIFCGYNYYCCYDFKLFPSLVYKIKHPKVVLLVFISKKIVFIGAKS